MIIRLAGEKAWQFMMDELAKTILSTDEGLLYQPNKKIFQELIKESGNETKRKE